MQHLPHHRAGAWDVFHRPENKNFSKDRHNQYRFHMPPMTLVEFMGWLHSPDGGRLPRGSKRGGVYEIQTDLGIYSTTDDNRIDVAPALQLAKVVFKTWEELDAEGETAERDAAHFAGC